MATALVIIDGMADVPCLGGKTPLAVAHTPVLDRLAQSARVGRWQPTPPSQRPGSEVGLFSCLGTVPPNIGRAAFEALGRGIVLQPGDVAYRVSPVQLSGSVTAVDSLFLDPSRDLAHIPTLQDVADWLLRFGVKFFPSRHGRHIMVIPAGELLDRPGPHDLLGLPVSAGGALPKWVPWADIQRRLNGVALWPWGGAGALPKAAMGNRVLIGAVPLVRGIGRWLGYRVPQVPGVTGDVDTDLSAKADAALGALAAGDDVVVHVEGPDMAAHRRDPAAKAQMIARIDRALIGPLAQHPCRLMVTCDHGTASDSGRHLDVAVPFLLAGGGPGGIGFDEMAVAEAPEMDAATWNRLLMEAPVGC